MAIPDAPNTNPAIPNQKAAVDVELVSVIGKSEGNLTGSDGKTSPGITSLLKAVEPIVPLRCRV